MDPWNLSDRDTQLLLIGLVVAAVLWFAFSLWRMLRQQQGRRRTPADRAEVRESARRRL